MTSPLFPSVDPATGLIRPKHLPMQFTRATATTVVEGEKVTGDTTNRFELQADGTISVGPGGTTALRKAARWNMDLKGTANINGLEIIASEDVNPGQPMVIYDHLGAPIFSVPAFGGPAVFGDNFRVHGQGDIFNHRHILIHDGTVSLNQGDPAGGVGVLAIGASATQPTRASDGSGTSAGGDTIAGVAISVDSNGRLRSRRASGVIDLLGGSPQQAAAPTAGVQAGDTYHSPTDRRLRAYDGAAWNRVGLDFTNVASFQPVVGEWLVSPTSGNGAGAAPTANQMILTPVDILEDGMTFNLVGVRIVGAGVGGTPRCRFGLYGDSGNGSRPAGAPIQDWGQTTAQLTASADSTIAISWAPPRLGRYWLGIVYQPTGTVTTVPTYQVTYGLQAYPSSSLDLSFGTAKAWAMNSVAGALPAISGLAAWGNGYSMGLKRSA